MRWLSFRFAPCLPGRARGGVGSRVPPFPFYSPVAVSLAARAGLKEAASLKQVVTRNVLSIVQASKRTRARAITEADKKGSVFRAMRSARANARLVGARQKKADEKAAEEAMKQKGGE